MALDFSYGLIYLLVIYGVERTSCAIPRGLEPSLAPFFDPERDFTCLDSSATIPFEQVNDDYCDCDDGSDEPGTSACPNGKFFCRNVGFESFHIFSSRVNDGICDCCDGTDEWASPVSPDGSNPCKNICLELGAEARDRRERDLKVARDGYVVRQKMVQQSEQIIQDTKANLEEKEEELEQLKQDVDVKSEQKKAAEAPEQEALDKYREEEERLKKENEEIERQRLEAEALSAFDTLDADQDGRISKAEIMVESKFDTNNDGIVSEEEVEFYMAANEYYDKDHFLATGWPLMRPALQETDATEQHHKKRAHRASSPDAPKAWNEAGQEVDADGVPTEIHGEEAVDQANDDDDDEEEYDDYGDDQEHGTEEDSEPDDTAIDEPAAPPPVEKSKYDDATQQLVDAADLARREYDEASGRLRDLEREVRDLKSSLETTYGEDNAFLPLKGQCFEFRDHEYVYRMCAFDHCTQRGISGGSDTRLGSWGHWDGPAHEPFSQMIYTSGLACWNGPSRSTKVRLTCGTDNVVHSVSEPNRCEYEMVFSTPAACKSPEYYEQQLHRHDEL